MINVSGYKVWPAEVESLMYKHPASHEVCIIAVQDGEGNESVKAVIALKAVSRERVNANDIIAWCRTQMTVYTVPRSVEFVDDGPKSSSGRNLHWYLQKIAGQP